MKMKGHYKHYKILILLLLFTPFIMGQVGSLGCRDSIKPAVVITFPTNGSIISGIIPINVEATDNIGVTKVEFYIDGIKIETASTRPYKYSWDTTNLQDESIHTIQVKAYDISGNVGESPIVTVTIKHDVITFADLDLKLAIADTLKIPKEQHIKREDIAKLTTLYASEQNIKDLSGIEHAVNLKILALSSNQITDITPLANLTNLQSLDLSFNKITDITPLANLINLQNLDLSSNKIKDITPLTRLNNLKELNLYYNEVSDISPLSNLINL